MDFRIDSSRLSPFETQASTTTMTQSETGSDLEEIETEVSDLEGLIFGRSDTLMTGSWFSIYRGRSKASAHTCLAT